MRRFRQTSLLVLLKLLTQADLALVAKMTVMSTICTEMDDAAQMSLTQMQMRLKHLTRAELALAANVSTICAKIESALFVLI